MHRKFSVPVALPSEYLPRGQPVAGMQSCRELDAAGMAVRGWLRFKRACKVTGLLHRRQSYSGAELPPVLTVCLPGQARPGVLFFKQPTALHPCSALTATAVGLQDSSKQQQGLRVSNRGRAAAGGAQAVRRTVSAASAHRQPCCDHQHNHNSPASPSGCRSTGCRTGRPEWHPPGSSPVGWQCGLLLLQPC